MLDSKYSTEAAAFEKLIASQNLYQEEDVIEERAIIPDNNPFKKRKTNDMNLKRNLSTNKQVSVTEIPDDNPLKKTSSNGMNKERKASRSERVSVAKSIRESEISDGSPFKKLESQESINMKLELKMNTADLASVKMNADEQDPLVTNISEVKNISESEISGNNPFKKRKSRSMNLDRKVNRIDQVTVVASASEQVSMLTNIGDSDIILERKENTSEELSVVTNISDSEEVACSTPESQESFESKPPKKVKQSKSRSGKKSKSITSKNSESGNASILKFFPRL